MKTKKPIAGKTPAKKKPSKTALQEWTETRLQNSSVAEKLNELMPEIKTFTQFETALSFHGADFYPKLMRTLGLNTSAGQTLLVPENQRFSGCIRSGFHNRIPDKFEKFFLDLDLKIFEKHLDMAIARKYSFALSDEHLAYYTEEPEEDE